MGVLTLSTGITCTNKTINVRTDELKFIQVGFNTTGVYGLGFFTALGSLFTYGVSLPDATLQSKIFSTNINNTSSTFPIIGMQGTLSANKRINSLTTIHLNTTCA